MIWNMLKKKKTLRNVEMRNAHCKTWNMARKLKKTWKMRHKQCMTWNVARNTDKRGK